MSRHSSRLVASVLTCAIGAAVLPASANTFTLTYEAPGVQNSTATFSQYGVENFDSRSVGSGETFVSTFGSSGISGTYAGVDIHAASQYGGAGGTGNFATTSTAAGYSVTFNQEVDYFGYWLSALDPSNLVTFYDGANIVGSFNAGTLLGSALTGNSAYSGNPNAPYQGQNSGQKYAFINFYSTSGSFNKVVFSQSPSGNGGYESDNHTVGIYSAISGTVLSVPEPASWALMSLGLVGLFGRRIRRAR